MFDSKEREELRDDAYIISEDDSSWWWSSSVYSSVRELVGDLRAADRHDIAMLAVVNCEIFSEINGESAACL